MILKKMWWVKSVVQYLSYTGRKIASQFKNTVWELHMLLVVKRLAQRTPWNQLISIYTCCSTVDFLYHHIFYWAILTYTCRKSSPTIILSRLIRSFFLYLSSSIFDSGVWAFVGAWSCCFSEWLFFWPWSVFVIQ